MIVLTASVGTSNAIEGLRRAMSSANKPKVRFRGARRILGFSRVAMNYKTLAQRPPAGRLYGDGHSPEQSVVKIESCYEGPGSRKYRK